MTEEVSGQVQFSWNHGFDPSPVPLQFANTDAGIGCGNATADLNSDGALDILVGKREEQELGGAQVHTRTVALGDAEGEADLDVICGGTGDRTYYSSPEGTPQKGLTYNLRLGTASGAYDLVSGVSAHGLGQLGHRTSHFLRQLEGGTYYWAVQTVDAVFKKSDWSNEASFSVASSRRICLPLVLRR